MKIIINCSPKYHIAVCLVFKTKLGELLSTADENSLVRM